MPSPEPPQLTPAAGTQTLAVPGARRVAVGLVLFGLWDLFATIADVLRIDFSQPFHINLGGLLTFLAYWFSAWLVWTNRRVIWPIMAYLCAAALGGAAGLVAGAWFAVPGRLGSALLSETVWGESGSFTAMRWFLHLVFFAWLLAECLRVMRLTDSRVRRLPQLARPLAVSAYSACLHALAVVGLFALLQGTWTQAAVSRARKVMTNGDRYDYLVINYQFQVTNGKGRYSARVLAYDENGFEPIDLSWQD